MPIASKIACNMLINKHQALVVKIEPPVAGIDYGRGLQPVRPTGGDAGWEHADVQKMAIHKIRYYQQALYDWNVSTFHGT